MLVCAVIGFLSFSLLPSMLELAVEISYPVPEVRIILKNEGTYFPYINVYCDWFELFVITARTNSYPVPEVRITLFLNFISNFNVCIFLL